MAGPIDYYFDFASPYGYFASHRIDEIAARYGRTVNWHPFLIGVAFKLTGQKPLVEQTSMRAEYFPHDWLRIGRRFGVPFTMPQGFPHAAVAPSRAFYWLLDRDPELAKRFAKRIYHAYFGEGREFTAPDMVADEAAALGVARDEVLAALNDQTVKDRLKAEVETAIDRKVFGSPTFYVDGEMFWGHDRLEEVEDWLKRGGW